MQSLKDKLLKAGLVSEEQAKKAEAEKAKPPPRLERGEREAPPEREARAPRPPRPERPERSRPAAARPHPPATEPRLPKFAPLAGSKEAQRNESKKQVQLDRTLREKVLAGQLAIEPGATTFYFVTRKGKLRRLELSAEQAKKLEEGKLAVVERPDPDKIEHALVPPELAAELIALSEKTVRFWNREGQAVGFLSEAEISARASEADEPAEAAEPAPAKEEPAAQPETWITIKRA